MRTRSSPEVEALEARQLPYGSLSVSGLGAADLLPSQPAATADPSLRSELRRSSEEVPGQGELQAIGDGGRGEVPGLVTNFWPAPSVASGSTSGQTTNQSSSNDPTTNAVSSLKGDSVRPDTADKLVCLPQHSAANASLPAQEASVASPKTKQTERLPPGGQGRVLNDDLVFHDVSGPGANAKRQESVLPRRNSSANEAALLAEKMRSGRGSRRQRAYSSGELATVFSLLAFDFANGSFSFRPAEEGCLNAKGVERYFSSAGCCPPNALLPCGEGGSLNPKPIGPFLVTFWDALPGLCPSLLRPTRPEDVQRAEEGEGLSVPPLYLSALLYRQPGKPLDPSAQQGLDRLCAYAWSSIRNAERVHGEKFLCPEDIVQEIYVEWRGLVGPQPEDEALGRLLQDGSEEMKFLRVAVQRVIGRVRYQQRQWTKGIDINRPADNSAAFARRGGQERIDWEDLWENVVSTLAPHEKQILELRKQGKTFAEIGSALGIPRQRACETYHSLVARLQKNYPDW